MWDEIRNDSFLRTIAVIVIGILLFGVLFNTTTGGGNMMGSGEYMGQGNGYGYSFSSIINWLLLVLIKILFFVLIGAVLIGAFVWIRNMFFTDSNSAIVRKINSDPILKIVVLTTLAIIGLFIVFGLLGSFNTPGYMNGGYNVAFGIAWLLIMLIRVLSYVLIISLVIAVAIYLKNQYDKGKISWSTDATVKASSVTTVESSTKPDDLDTTI